MCIVTALLLLSSFLHTPQRHCLPKNHTCSSLPQYFSTKESSTTIVLSTSIVSSTSIVLSTSSNLLFFTHSVQLSELNYTLCIDVPLSACALVLPHRFKERYFLLQGDTLAWSNQDDLDISQMRGKLLLGAYRRINLAAVKQDREVRTENTPAMSHWASQRQKLLRETHKGTCAITDFCLFSQFPFLLNNSRDSPSYWSLVPIPVVVSLRWSSSQESQTKRPFCG